MIMSEDFENNTSVFQTSGGLLVDGEINVVGSYKHFCFFFDRIA